mmetsp:Transcript_19656/g.47645  ORF Transcript_19656/g.47645 Transcript_19656/m.47645 type:complete len:206 (+) Transcript_19656:17-634(+)
MVLSLKRSAEHGGPLPKAPRTDPLSRLKDTQTKICELEELCAREQIAVQRRYDCAKQPHISDRGEIIKELPQFWYRTLKAYSDKSGRSLFSEADLRVLENVASIHLNDNLDTMGSYEITFEFKENQFLESTRIKRTVKVDSDSEFCTASAVVWKKDVNPTPFFTFFGTQPVQDGDFGELFRLEIWQDPVLWYLQCEANHSQHTTS